MTDQANNVQAAVDAGRAAAEAAKKVIGFLPEEGGVPIAIIKTQQGGEQAIVLKDALDLVDARAAVPRRLRGTAVLTDVDSFVAHVLRFKDPGSVVFADKAGVNLQAVYDYHGGAREPRWAQHRATYSCPLSRQWKLWLAANGLPMGQEDFGNFIDDNMGDLAAGQAGDEFPAPTKVLEMARNLVVRSKGTFERKLNPTTGEATLVTKDEHEAESTKIYRAFLIGIPVFEGGEAYRVEARLRFSLNNGRPTFAFALYQYERVLEDAFGEVCAKVKAATELPLYAGKPE